jgi:hypothetical protein
MFKDVSLLKRSGYASFPSIKIIFCALCFVPCLCTSTSPPLPLLLCLLLYCLPRFSPAFSVSRSLSTLSLSGNLPFSFCPLPSFLRIFHRLFPSISPSVHHLFSFLIPPLFFNRLVVLCVLLGLPHEEQQGWQEDSCG